MPKYAIDPTWGNRKIELKTFLETVGFETYKHLAEILNRKGFLSKTGQPFTTNIAWKAYSSVKPLVKTEEDVTMQLSINDVTKLLLSQDSGERFPVNLEHVNSWLGYSRYLDTVRALVDNPCYKEGINYSKKPRIGAVQNGKHDYYLTVETFIDFVITSETVKARESKRLVVATYIEHMKSKVAKLETHLIEQASIFPPFAEERSMFTEALPEERLVVSKRVQIDKMVKDHCTRLVNTYIIAKDKGFSMESPLCKEILATLIPECRKLLNGYTNSVGHMRLKQRTVAAGFKETQLMTYAESDKSISVFTVNGEKVKCKVIDLMYKIAHSLFPIDSKLPKQSAAIQPASFTYLMNEAYIKRPKYISTLRDMYTAHIKKDLSNPST